MRARLRLAAALVAVLCAPLAGQQTAGTPANAPAGAGQVEAPVQPPYSYSREGRRDPFVSLIGRGGEQSSGSVRPPGLPGILIQEVRLNAIVRLSSGYVAMVQGPDKKTYPVRPGQRLLDGTVKAITREAVVFSQDVNDPLSLVRQREVRKTLRSNEEGQG